MPPLRMEIAHRYLVKTTERTLLPYRCTSCGFESLARVDATSHGNEVLRQVGKLVAQAPCPRCHASDEAVSEALQQKSLNNALMVLTAALLVSWWSKDTGLSFVALIVAAVASVWLYQRDRWLWQGAASRVTVFDEPALKQALADGLAEENEKAARLKPKPKVAPRARTPLRNETWEKWFPIGLAAVVLVLSTSFVASGAFKLNNDQSAEVVELGLAGLAFAVLAWGLKLTREKRERDHQVLRDRLLITIGLSSFLAYFNFGHLHFDNFVHVWDTYHYYMGAKYFPEVGYDRLYQCAAVVDVESGRGTEAAGRRITDLRTNQIVRGEMILEHPEECTSHFTPERWVEFKRDANLFRNWVGEKRWGEMHLDHGFNATPVWTLAGMALANVAPHLESMLAPSDPAYQRAVEGLLKGDATALWAYNEQRRRQGLEPITQPGGRHVQALNLLDPLYLALTLLMVWWAFGPRAFAIAALVLGTNFPNRFYWTGGSYLRHDWVFYLVASVCLLKKEKPGLAGAALAYSALLRLFPGLMLVGPVLGAVEYFRRHKKLDPVFLRFCLGGIIATVVLVAATFKFFGGVQTWEHFAQNTVKHAKTPLTNHMGLRTVLSYRPTTTGQQTTEPLSMDPWLPWKNARLENFSQLKPVFYALCLGAMVLIYLSLRQTGPVQWMAAAFGIGFIVFGAELTNYYYCFLMGMAVLHEKKREVGLIFAGLAVVTQLIDLGPFIYMAHELDQQYVAMSVASLFAMVALWWSFTKWGEPACVDPEVPVDLDLPIGAATAKRA